MSNAMQEIKARWQARYGHLEEAHRAALVKEETQNALDKLKASGIVPTMSADELMEITRG